MRDSTFVRAFAFTIAGSCIALAGLLPYWTGAMAAYSSYGSPGPFWNFWMRAKGDDKGVRAAPLNTVTTLALDLARVPYNARDLREVSASLREFLSTLRGPVDLVIRPVLDAHFRLPPGGQIPSTIRIDPARLRPTSSDDAIAKRLGERQAPVLSEVAEVRAATYELDVVPVEPGCASIFYSIWDQTGNYPLDVIHNRLWIADPGGSNSDASKCEKRYDDSQYFHRELDGFKDALDISAVMSGRKHYADAALYLMSYGYPERETIGMYFDIAAAKKGLPAANSPGVHHAGVYSWRLDRPIEDLLSDAILPSIVSARSAAQHGNPYPYADVASYLKNRLFPPGGAGESALAALQFTAARGQPFSSVLVVSSQDGWGSGYLPLGLLAAKAPNPVLSKPIVEIEPLPRTRLAHKGECVSTWSMAIPDQLDAWSGPLPTELSNPPNGWISQRLGSREDLRTYFAKSKALPAAGEGLVLFAHHSKGDIWYESGVDPLRWTDLRWAHKRLSKAV